MEFETISDELAAIVDTGLKFAKKHDPIAEYEIFLMYKNIFSVNNVQGVLESKDGVISGVGIRVALDKKVGFFSSSGIDPDVIQKTIIEAHTIAKHLPIGNDKFMGFANKESPGKIGFFCNEILAQDCETLVPASEKIRKDVLTREPRVSSVVITIESAYGGFSVGNTSGVLGSSSSALNTLWIDVKVKEGVQEKSSYDGIVSRHISIENTNLEASSIQKALDLLNSKKLNYTGQMQTIWDPTALGEHIRYGLGAGISGNNIIEGISPLKDQLGEKIAVNQLNIVDRGQDPLSPKTEAIDEEGERKQDNVIIENGVLKQFLFNSYYGKISGTGSTGNASRGFNRPQSFAYDFTPDIALNCFHVEEGAKTMDELISDVEKQAILLKNYAVGMHHSSPSTGEFSVVFPEAFLIEKGEIKFSIPQMSVSGNFFDGLKNIHTIGKGKIRNPEFIVTPPIKFDGFTIVG
ncbi:MAG: TldD/PmbA family protein [Candidatus Hodarchaeota archaeon]